MKNKNFLKSAIIGLFVAATATIYSASAATYGVTCDIAIYPFNPLASPTLSQYTPNKITSQSLCKTHLAYPDSASTGQPYNPVPPSLTENQVKAGDEDMQVPWVIHEHAYYNDSGPLGPNYYYKAALDKFEITIEPDLSKLDIGDALQNLQCVTPKPSGSSVDVSSLNDCSGTVSGLYGGTSVSKQKVGDSIIITWEFGLNTNPEKPIIFGANGSSFPVTQNGNTINLNLSSPNSPYRHAEFKVNFPTKDNNEPIWVGTTTSRALIADLAILKTNFAANGKKGCGANINASDSGWCYLNPNNYNSYPKVQVGKGGTPRTYFWYPIGSVASIWKKPETPPEAVCTGLDLTIAQGGNTYNANNPAGIQPNQPMQLNVTPSFNPANQSIPLKYRWTGMLNLQPQGEFKDDQNSPLNGNPFIDLNTSTWYSGGDANTVVRVVALDQNDQPVGCDASFPIPPEDEGGMCLSLTANYSKPIQPGETITINPQVNYSPDLQPETITWSETGDGYFTNVPFQNVLCQVGLNQSTFTKPYFCSYQYTAVSEGDSFTLTANPNPTDNDACILNDVVTDGNNNNVCDYLNFRQPENGQICIDVDSDYTGEFEWEIDGVSSQSFDTCKPYDENSTYHVEAVDAPTACFDDLQPEENECSYFNFTFPGDEICVDTDYEGDVEWIFNGGSPETTNQDECFQYNPAFSYEAAAVNTDNPDCKAAIPPEESELIKSARRTTSEPYSTQILTLRPNDTTVYYQLRYVPLNNQKYSTTIVDTISQGYIDARLFPETTGREPGRIDYNEGSMRVIVNGQEIDTCQSIVEAAGEDEDPVIEDCYVGDIGNGGVRLVEVMGEALISYSGEVDSALTDEACREGTICQEKYINEAETENSVVHVDEDSEEDIPEVHSNPITVQLFCQYILTRAAGDIFLENDLSTGIDINQCSRYRSSTGIIITPGEEDTPPLVSTGAGDTTIFSVGHEVCTAGQAGKVTNELAELYGSDITGLSSQICEVKLRTGSPWKQEIITNSIDENKTRASRWGADPALGNNLSTMLFTYPDEDVYHVKGDVQSGAIRMDEVGAKTFIIEDGDLHITDNIVYTGTCPAGPGQCSVRDVASLAFIVLNGSIYVDPGVTQISGVYFVQEGEADGSGRLYSGAPGGAEQQSDEQLTIYGSVYGDIDPLFAKRFFSGDPSSELGGIVVRFDQRVILNTPPALRDILNLSQTEVAR
ncbi:MAG: hypothetical protein R3B71_05795 [Candidatus Gracilibacteria bacterium]